MIKKALFFDVDGTLIDDKTKVLPQSAVEAIKKAKEKGHKIFINSGRVVSMLRDIANILEVDGIVAGCGTFIEVDNKVIYEHRVSLDNSNMIKKALLDNKLEGFLESRERVYMPKRPFVLKEMEEAYKIIKEIIEVREDAFIDETYIFDKFCVLANPKTQAENINKLKEISKNSFYIIDRGSGRGEGFFEFVPKGHSKGEAILKVLEYYNIPLEETYIFGDSMNDISMFRSNVAHKIALEEHDEEITELATFITKKVLDDGIAYAMKKLKII